MNSEINDNTQHIGAIMLEPSRAPFPVMAAKWDGDDPYQAMIVFENERLVELCGHFVGTKLIDLFEDILRSGEIRNTFTAHELFDTLLSKGRLQQNHGQLSRKRIGLFAWMQPDSPNTILISLFDTSHHYVDLLTQVPRREIFFDRLRIELLRAVREKSEVHLCFIDLDNFKPINDTHGHQCGDIVLQKVAKRLKKLVRRHETVARLGGDEFIIMLSGHDVDPLTFAEQRIIPSICKPYALDCAVIDTLSVSIGIASFPRFAAKADELVTYADDAMYAAKAKGKNCAVMFDPCMIGSKKM